MRLRDRALAASLAALAVASLPLSAAAQAPPPPAPVPAPAAPGATAAPTEGAAELQSKAQQAASAGDMSSPAPAPVAAPAPAAPVSAAGLAQSQPTGIAPVLTPGPLGPVGGSVLVPLPAVEPKEEPPTRLGDFMDTRLSWTLGDDDVLHPTGQAQPSSLNWNIGDRRQYRLFFDNLNSRFGGRENLTHLALYKKMPGFIRGLDTEASLVMRLDLGALATNTNNLNQALYDAGSYVRAFYHMGGGSEGKTGIGVTFWPLDTDRFRLGYLYDISWGGTNAASKQSIFPGIQGFAPGAKVQYDGGKFSVYAGFKTATLVQPEDTLIPGTSEVESVHQSQAAVGLLLGGSGDLSEILHVDLGAGYFQQGRFELQGVFGQPIYTLGGSARVVLHDKDMPIAQSIDFLLYRNDPNKVQVIFKPEVYTPSKTTWSASVEFSDLVQRLKDFDAVGVATFQQARALAIQGNVKSGYLRASLTGIYRDLPFVLRNQPSFMPFVTIPKAAKTSDELFFAGALDYHFPALHLTPGIGAGFQLPATFQSSSIDIASAPIERTVVVRELGNLAALPLNKHAVPIIQARASLRWEVSKILSVLAWAQVVHDNNGTFIAPDPVERTFVLRTFISPDFFGFGVSVQARF